MIVIRAKDINDAFHQILFKFFEKNEEGTYKNAYTTCIDAGSFEHKTTRLQTELAVEIEYPSTRPLATTFPEGLGIPPVASQDAVDTYFANYLMNGELTKNEEYTYGNRILEFSSKGKKFNQLDWVINHFKAYPQNNHCCIEIAKGDDLLLKHAPCLRLISFKLVEGKLSITAFFRSWDFWSGFSINLGGLQLLNEYVADEIGAETGKMFGMSDGLHIYSHSIPYALLRMGIGDTL